MFALLNVMITCIMCKSKKNNNNQIAGNNTERWCFIDRFLTYRATELGSGVTKYFLGSVEVSLRRYVCLLNSRSLLSED